MRCMTVQLFLKNGTTILVVIEAPAVEPMSSRGVCHVASTLAQNTDCHSLLANSAVLDHGSATHLKQPFDKCAALKQPLHTTLSLLVAKGFF